LQPGNLLISPELTLSVGFSISIALHAATRARRLLALTAAALPPLTSVTLWITTAIHLDTPRIENLTLSLSNTCINHQPKLQRFLMERRGQLAEIGINPATLYVLKPFTRIRLSDGGFQGQSASHPACAEDSILRPPLARRDAENQERPQLRENYTSGTSSTTGRF
jgi:hypothetical protein